VVSVTYTVSKIPAFVQKVTRNVLKKSKAVPLHAMEAHGGRGGIAPAHT
jgi:hypothetical protein